jgi:uncharacterized repeat protein (TIGR03803 family)
MKSSKTFRTLCLAFACAAFTFSPAVRAQGQTVNFLYDFHATGQQSQAISMIQGTDGNFYGAADGGANNEGQIFRMTPAGQFTTIYNFCSEANCADGQEAQSSPILGSDGNLYGVADGGSGESGTVYKMTLGGHITTLYTLCEPSLQ